MRRSMKDSHIDWIGAIPEDWSTIPFRRVFEITKRLAGKTGLDVLSVTQQGIKIKDLSSNEGQMAQDYSNYQLVFPTDFVMNHMDLLTGYVDISSYTGVTSPDYRVFRARKPQEISLEYFLHIFQLCYKCKIFYHLGQGVSGLGRWRLPAKQMLLFELPLPPLNEQESIADFLDNKCGEIDEMVSLQEKIVEELKAYKQSVITEAVCKGLNPDVPMKDSGIEWIGEIPEGWDCCQLKYKIQLINGRAYADNEFLESGKYRVLRVGNLFTNGKWYYSDMELEPEKYCEKGDLLYAWSASFGPHIWNEEKVIYHYHIWKTNLNGIEKKFAFYMLAALTFFKRSDAHGTAMVHITMENMNKSYIPLPPQEEQQAIADYLDTKCAEIDTLISVRQSKIDALKEYKKSIIYEYITGKKEIPA